MACRASRDQHGTTYHVPEGKTGKTPGGHQFPGCAALDVWWKRDPDDPRDETVIIRQESNNERADVIELTLGQVYDLIHALGHAVLRS